MLKGAWDQGIGNIEVGDALIGQIGSNTVWVCITSCQGNNAIGVIQLIR
jgi:hypothetical protein